MGFVIFETNIYLVKQSYWRFITTSSERTNKMAKLIHKCWIIDHMTDQIYTPWFMVATVSRTDLTGRV
jgi:hypothetical protein